MVCFLLLVVVRWLVFGVGRCLLSGVGFMLSLFVVRALSLTVYCLWFVVPCFLFVVVR